MKNNMKQVVSPAEQVADRTGINCWLLVQELYDFSRNKLQQKVSQRFLVNRGVLYDILKV